MACASSETRATTKGSKRTSFSFLTSSRKRDSFEKEDLSSLLKHKPFFRGTLCFLGGSTKCPFSFLALGAKIARGFFLFE